MKISKKLILMFLLGFFLNSGLRMYYSHIWWEARYKVSQKERNDSYNQYGYMKIVYDTIGIQDNLKYTIVYPCKVFKRWTLCYP